MFRSRKGSTANDLQVSTRYHNLKVILTPQRSGNFYAFPPEPSPRNRAHAAKKRIQSFEDIINIDCLYFSGRSLHSDRVEAATSETSVLVTSFKASFTVQCLTLLLVLKPELLIQLDALTEDYKTTPLSTKESSNKATALLSGKEKRSKFAVVCMLFILLRLNVLIFFVW